MNKWIGIGRLTADPTLRYSQQGIAVASFTLAVNRMRTNAQGEREADFIPIVVWQKQAENCANYLTKGSLVAVEGRLQVRSYDGKDGKRWVTEVVAENVRFLDKKGDSKQDSAGSRLGQEVTFDENDIPF